MLNKKHEKMILLDVPSILNEDFIVNAEPMQGFLFTLLSICGTIALSGVIYGYADNPSPSTKICILGQKGSGKTTFLNWLRNRTFTSTYSQTFDERYASFDYNGKKIEGGRDIGGGTDFVKDYYEDMINQNDVCIFLFDAHKFISDEVYRQGTWDRAAFIYSKCPDSNKRHTIGTHFDQTSYDNVNKLREHICDLSKHKCFADMFLKSCTIVDLTKKESFEDCAKRIFGV